MREFRLSFQSCAAAHKPNLEAEAFCCDSLPAYLNRIKVWEPLIITSVDPKVRVPGVLRFSDVSQSFVALTCSYSVDISIICSVCEV